MVQIIEYDIVPCKSKAAVSVKPLNQVKLDFNKLRKQFEILLDNPIALVLKVGDDEVIVHNYGEMLFKTLKDEGLIRKIADKIFEEAVL
ncbi:hypothetical protein KY330_00705 [Candidatus Woesearchaeota archaeon]|nr:hypothetical protein [Candidatus Woesearchaeota archaeon]